MTADIEAYALINSDLRIPFEELCNLTGNQNLCLFMKRIAKKQNSDELARLRYVTSIADKGNKSRGVAISDY
jgi:hypothetical protein